MTTPGAPLVAVTDHAAERFRQRIAGAVDAKAEIVERVSSAWAAGRVSDAPPPGATGARGSKYVSDRVERSVVYVCRYDPRAHEALVITLWERPDGVAPPRVDRRFTDALKRDERRRPPD